jgi:hypothetical protein
MATFSQPLPGTDMLAMQAPARGRAMVDPALFLRG